MPLPTRRPIRPDSRHHREARRQRLSRSGGGHAARRFWSLVAGVSLVAFIVAALVRMFGSQPHGWVMPTIYTSLAAVVVSVIMMLLGLRG